MKLFTDCQCWTGGQETIFSVLVTATGQWTLYNVVTIKKCAMYDFPYRFLLVMCSLLSLWLWGLFFSMTVCAVHVCVCVCPCVSVKGCISSAKLKMLFGLSLVDKLYLRFLALSSPPRPPAFLSCLVWMRSQPQQIIPKVKTLPDFSCTKHL